MGDNSRFFASQQQRLVPSKPQAQSLSEALQELLDSMARTGIKTQMPPQLIRAWQDLTIEAFEKHFGEIPIILRYV